MSLWRERVFQEPAWKNLAEILQILEAVEPLSDEPPEAVDYLDRLRHVISHVRTRLEATDPQLISSVTLSQLTDLSNTLLSLANQYQESREFANLASAQNYLESLIVTSGELPPLPWGESESVVSNAAEAFRTELDSLKDQTQRHAATFAEDLTQLGEQMRTLLAETRQSSTNQGLTASQRAEELENSLSSAKSEFETTVTEFESRISDQVQRLDRAISDSSRRVSLLEQGWLQEFNGSQEERRSSFHALVESSTDTAKIHNDYLRETGEKAAEVLGITAASGVAGAYRTYANEQQTAPMLTSSRNRPTSGDLWPVALL